MNEDVWLFQNDVQGLILTAGDRADVKYNKDDIIYVDDLFLMLEEKGYEIRKKQPAQSMQPYIP